MNLLRYGLIAAGLLLINSCTEPSEDTYEEVASDIIRPAIIPYSIVHVYPHDTTAFTEGLEFHDGYLYESTGQYGSSELKKTDPETGRTLKSVKLDKRYFGEGMTIMNGKIYQLTYMEHTGFVYDLAEMKLERTFSVVTDEAWGLCNDGTHLIYGDGSSYLYFLDPETFREVKRIEVRNQYGPVREVNELEYINGYLYANQWRKDHILKIDPATGNVVGIADLRSLRPKLGIPLTMPMRENAPEVLNGIAYDSATNRIFITGKFWPHMVEVKLDN
jgi:glutamine cyclotransferase